MILFSVFCVVLSLEFGVATPSGNRFKESRLQNEGSNKLNVERNIGEPTNPYEIPNNENELISQENQKNILVHNENYETIDTNNNPALRNVNEQPDVTSESKEYNQNTAEKNLNTFNDESSGTSYIASPPQVNRIQTFRPRDGENNEANIPRKADILSEVKNPKNDIPPNESNAPIIQEKNPANQIKNKYIKKGSQESKIFNDMKEEDATQLDVPEATPEYTKSLFNQYKHTKKANVRPTITNMPRNNINNKKFQPNSQNVNEANFQNPSAEILYETGQAKPYEINNEPLVNSRQGHTHAHHVLNDKQRLKNLYLSSKPTKHYMIVYPDGRVEQVDNLDKIRKVHPNYVMLNAKELLQHGKTNAKVSTLPQESVVKQNPPTTTTTTIKPQLNSIKDTKVEQVDKVPQTVNEQTLPVPIEPFPDATESPTLSTTEVTKTNNFVKSSKDEAVTERTSEKNKQNQLQESEINNSQEKNKININEITNSGEIANSSDISSIQVSSTSTTENPGIEDALTTVRSTKSTPTTDSEILNQNTSLSISNNTDSPNLSKEPEDSNSTSGILINTKDDSAGAVENTTPTPKQESNEDDEITKNTTTLPSDLNTIKENSYTPDGNETSNVIYETSTSNSSLASSANREESHSSTKSNNETVITFKDGTDSNGNTFHTETIITNNNNESSNNVTSSVDSVLITNTNKTDTIYSSTENAPENISPLNVTSSNSLTNNTLNNPEKDGNSTYTIQIKNVSNDTKSEVDETKNEEKNIKPYTSDINSESIYTDASSHNTPGEAYDVRSTQKESNLNKTFSTNVEKDGSKYTDDGIDDSDAPPAEIPDVLNEEDSNTVTDASNDYKMISLGGAVSSNDEDSDAPDTASNDSDYLNSPRKGVNEDDEDDDSINETRSETTNTDDNFESPSSDENIVNESSIWFNANESFWKKLMNSNEHNSFYFLFPRPQPNTKETKKITYPNGTIVVETTETVDSGDGETTSSKTVLTCGNCTTCEKTL